MAESWTCPSCQRRVPGTVEVCRCGTHRGFAEVEASPLKVKQEPLPRDIKMGLAALGVLALVAIATLFRPSEPNTIPPLLGYVDQMPEAPSPEPRPSASPSPTPRPSGVPPPPRVRAKGRSLQPPI